MREINKISESLFEKIRDRFEDVSLGDENAKATQDPEKARFFNFDYVVDGKSYGNITISIIDELSLKVYFSKNISHDLSKEERDHWYGFLRELREFAKRNLLSFEPRDITRSTLKHRDIQQQSKADSTFNKDEIVSESKMWGTSKSSYQECGPVKIIVRHSDRVDPERKGDRARKIHAILLQNKDGERFKLPHNSLRYARAMARHVSEGGSVIDEFGQHITEIADEVSKLRPFKYGMQHRVFEDEETQQMVEAAFEYHGLLNHTLKRLTGKKGYKKVKEAFKAEESLMDDIDTQSLKEKFVKRIFDDKLEGALPLVQKAYEMKKQNKFAEYFESWADTLAEGTWAIPETDEEIDALVTLFQQPLPLGVDGQNATNALYDIIGDDKLFDELQAIADVDPDDDARDIVLGWLQTNLPEVYEKVQGKIPDFDQAQQPTAEVPAEPMAEGFDPEEFGGEIDWEFTGDDGEPGYGSISYQATVVDERPVVVPQSLKGYCQGDGNNKLNDDWCTEMVQPGGYEHKEALQAAQEDAEEQWQSRERDIPTDEGTYGSAIPGSTQNMLATTNEGEWQEDDVEIIQSAIIRRILNNIGEHGELLKKAGPDGVMNAARDVASFHAPMEEIGSSDVSIMVREVYREVGVEYPETNEAKDTIKYDPKTGKLTGWEHEGDWKKQTKKKDPVGKIHHMSDVARRRTEKMAQSDTLEEAFEKALSEAAINVGDKVKCPNGKEGTITGDADGYYHVKGDDGETYSYRMQEVKPIDEEITMPDNPDYSKYDKPTFQRNNPKELPKKSGWTGYNTDEPAYKRKADYEQEREQLKKLAGLK